MNWGWSHIYATATVAAWVQAIGSLVAIAAAWGIARGQDKRERRRERARAIAAEEADRVLLRNRAVGLAHLTLNRLEATRRLIEHDQIDSHFENIALAIDVDLAALRGFPIWQLSSGEAMINFSTYPGLLDLAHRQALLTAQQIRKAPQSSKPDYVRYMLAMLEELIATADRRGRELRALLDG